MVERNNIFGQDNNEKIFRFSEPSGFIPLSSYVPISKDIRPVRKKINHSDITNVPSFSVYEGDYLIKTALNKKSFFSCAKDTVFKMFKLLSGFSSVNSGKNSKTADKKTDLHNSLNEAV